MQAGTFTNSTSTVVFDGSSAQSIAGSGATPFYNLTTSGSGTKTFNTSIATLSNTLTVGTGHTLNANSRLTLLATSGANANVAAIPITSSVTGDFNVQVYFTGNNNSSYRSTRAISSPVTNATYTQLKTYMVITGTNGGGFDMGGVVNPYATTLTKYNESAPIAQPQFTPINAITDPMTPGEGTFLFYRGDRTGYTPGTASTSSKVNATFATPENVTMQYTGPINHQNVAISVPRTNNNEATYDGYKLIGNPYPAVINWSNVTKSNMATDFRIIKPTGGFITYLGGVLAGTAGWSGDPFHILPGQAFYARANAGGGTVTFTESAKSLSTTPMRLMSSPKQSLAFNSVFGTTSKTVNKELRLTLQNDEHIEEAVAVFKAGSDSLAKEEDAVLFGGTSVTLSTLSSDKVRLTINFMPELKTVKELKLGVSATSTGPVRLKFTDLAAAENYDVIMEDDYLKTSTDVRSITSYDFIIDRSIPASFGNGRLKLTFKPRNRVVNLIANKAAKGAELQWSLESDPDNGKFEIERSEDGVNFTPIGSLSIMALTSSYQFLDSNPIIGTNYYRLKQIDDAGNIVVSSSASLDYLVTDNLTFSVYPNPVIDIVNISTNKRQTPLLLSINDMQGKVVLSKKYSKDQLLQANLSSLSTGIYIIQLRVDGSNEIIGTAKLIKQ
jgi:hypothetical protein